MNERNIGIIEFDLIPKLILDFWDQKYGKYLMASKTNDLIIFYENGTLDSFHPSGDRLARYHIPSQQMLYIWNNNVNEPLTEKQYLDKLQDILWEEI